MRKIISSVGNRIQDDRVGSLDTKPTAVCRLWTKNVKGRSTLHTISIWDDNIKMGRRHMGGRAWSGVV